MSAFVRRLAVVAATGLVALGFGLVHAGSAHAARYVACGYGTEVPLGTGGSSCMTLPDAISAAEASFGSDTIDMLPGDYCPIHLTGSISSSITFVGVGLAGVDTSGGPFSLVGPEAGMTAFRYDSGHCGSSSTAAVQLDASITSGGFTFENLTIDGTGTFGYGLYDYGNAHNLTLRDVIVQHSNTAGIYYLSGSGGFVDYSLEVDHSAILDNGVGIQLFGFGSVYDSTIAGNTNTGIVFTNVDASMGGDTISHNAAGVSAGCCGNNIQAVDTIVAGNTQNCSASNDWEQPASSSWNNLLESSNSGCPKRDTTDVVASSITVPSVDENGGPTPSILPPSAAQGAGAGPCGLQGVDQREYVVSGGSCDIGAVQQSANGTPNVNAPALALGVIDTGIAASATSDPQNIGGDLVGVSGVSISGAGWRIVSDGCTYAVLIPGSNGFCGVGVSVTPTGDGEWDGTLTVHTTAGTEHIALTSQAVTRATGQDDAYDVPDASLVIAAPGVLANDQAGATVDEVVTQPANGTLTGPEPDGSFTYTPNGGFIGDDSFQYTVIANGLYESHPITATLHILGFTLSLDSASYPSTPGGTFTIEATVTPLRNFTGDVCLDLADTNGSTWPSSVSPGGGYPTCSSGGGDVVVRAHVVLDGTNPAIVDLPVNVAADAAPGLQPLEVIASFSGAPSVVAPFGLTLPTTDAPSISGFHPSVGGAGATVTITGSNLTGATAVTFGGTAAASFTVDSDSRITAVVGSGATGTIAVTTPLGTGTSSGTFTFAAPPTITTFTPGSGGAHSTVTLTGTNLALTTQVQLNGTSCPFTASATKLTFTVPTGATSGTIHVTTPGGSATSTDPFTVSPPPTITSISPGNGPVGTTVTITGTGLDGTVGVMLGSVVTVPTSVGPTSVTFTVPPGAVTGTIKILSPAGSAVSVDTFTVTG